MKKRFFYQQITVLVMLFVLLCAGSSAIPGSLFFQNELKNSSDETDINHQCICSDNTPEEEWNYTFGGLNDERGQSVQQTSDGGFIIIANIISYETGNADIWLIRTNANGEEMWNRSIGGDDFEQGYEGQQTEDGGFIIVGLTDSFETKGSDVWLVKTDAQGFVQWNATFGRSEGDDIGSSVKQTDDGGFILSGSTISDDGDSDMWLIRTDATGVELWNKSFGGDEYDAAESVLQTPDNGFILIGRTWSYGKASSNVWMVKTNEKGVELWNKSFGGDEYDAAESVQQTTDNGFIVTGWTKSYGAGDDDLWLIKTDADGVERWNQTFGGSSYDRGHSVQQTGDGGFIIAGMTGSYRSVLYGIWVIRTDTYGAELWNWTADETRIGKGYSVQQTRDGGFIVTGMIISFEANSVDVLLMKIARENQPPTLTIINPKKGYIHLYGIPLKYIPMNEMVDSYSFGGFRRRPIQVQVIDDHDDDGELFVELYVNEEYRGICHWNEKTNWYEMIWVDWMIGPAMITIKASDTDGAAGISGPMKVWSLCFFTDFR